MTRPRLLLLVSVAAFLLAGAYAFTHRVQLQNKATVWVKIQLTGEEPAYDPFGRLAGFPGKMPIACPAQDARTMVLMTIGQSNSANHAARFHASAHGDRVVNYAFGQCTLAASPLLGATGNWGEPWTLLADKLIAGGLAERVVLIPAGVGGTPIERWRQGGDLNAMLLDTVRQAESRYRITHVLWHQGEADLVAGTTSEAYRAMFLSLAASLREAGVDAPVFVSVASRCKREWMPDNPVALAQRALPSAGAGIYPGVDTDALLTSADRYDRCHFAASGQEKFAAAWLDILRAHAAR